MRDSKVLPGFNDRLAAQAEARKALLAKFKPKPTVQAGSWPRCAPNALLRRKLSA
jgi:hypothetical protein